MKSDASTGKDKSAASSAETSSTDEPVAYRPERVTARGKIADLIAVKTIHPIYALYLTDLLATADPLERIAVLESTLQVPGTVARHVRMPDAEELPPGTLTNDRLDPELLTLGLATPEELGQTNEQDEDRYVPFEERVWPLTIGEKALRLFRHEHPRVDDVSITPAWIVGRLMEFDFNFQNFVTSYKLQKDEGILFRHCLRMVLLLGELANVPPPQSTVETWEHWLDDLAERLTQMCRKVDPQSTDEIIVTDPTAQPDLPTTSRRRTTPPPTTN